VETRVNREEFLRALQNVRAGLAQREILEQSTCFVFTEGQVITYNDDTACRGPSGLPDQASGVVQSGNLLEILSRIDQEEIRVTVSDVEFTVTAKRQRYGYALQSDIRLPYKNVEQPGRWKPLPEQFADAVHLVQQCAGKDQSNWVLTCVNLSPEYIEACDDFQMCRWSLETGLKESTIVKRESVETLASLGVTEVSLTENWIHFRNKRGFVLSCRRYVDEFPSDKLTPYYGREGTKVSMPKGLKAACEKANFFSQETADENMVTVELNPNSVTVTGQGLTGYASIREPCNWDGEPITFMAPPGLLGEVTSKYNDVEICRDDDNSCPVLKVQGSSYVYVTVLAPPKGEQESEPEEKPKKKRKKAEVEAE
jgi:hypothetical protein